jgi:chromosome transmission fidelity protein 4
MEEEEDDDFDDGEFDNLGVMSEAARKAAKASRRKKKREDSGKGSQVYFNRFETFGRNADKDWVVGLPDGERVMGCATGKGWCGVITRFVFISSFYFFTICHLLTCPLIPSNAAEGSYVSLQMLVFKVQ